MSDALETSRALLAALAQMEEGVIVADARGAIVFINAAASRMHGVEQLDVEVEEYAAAYHLLTEDGEPYPSTELPLARAVLYGETIIDARWRIRRPDGTEVLALGSARPILADDGARMGAVLTVRDDTARDALARQLRDTFSQSPRSTVIYDSAGTPIFVNKAFEQLWGARLADVPAGYSVLTDPQLEAGGAIPALRLVFAGEPATLPALRYEMADANGTGRTLWTQAHAYPVRDANGAVERVVLTHEDVTAKLEAEVARERTVGLQALTAALSQASTTTEVCAAIVEHSAAILGAVGIVVARPTADDEHLEIASASHMPTDLRADWQRFSMSAQVPIADVARSREPLFLASRESWRERYRPLLPALEAAGHHANVVLPLLLNERLHGVLGAAFDAPQDFNADYRAAAVTLARLCAQALERARLFEAERRARESAELANRAKSEFLAVMSHELRTPLNAIGGYAELIEMGIRGPITDEQRKDLERIQKSQRHLLGLVNGVLNYSRLEAGAVTYDVEDVPLDEILASCEALVAPQVRAKRLALEYTSSLPGPLVRADGEKLQQIVLNLLTNAIKFTEPGGRVDMGYEQSGVEVRITITDTGRGIAMDQLVRVFEPFVQVDAKFTRTQEGVGLGLAISRDLARGMGGDLTVTSTPGLGSTFSLSLPLAGER